MPLFKDEAEARSWLLDQWTNRFAAAISSMTGETVAAAAGAAQSAGDVSWYQQELSLSRALLFVGASALDWRRLGKAALEGAGLSGVSDEDALGACLELVAQATSGLAQAVGHGIGQEISAQPPRDAGQTPPTLEAGAFSFDLGPNGPLTLLIAPGPGLCTALLPSTESLEQGPPPAQQGPGQIATLPQSRTLDLLMEVELPVSISFGRANLPLREVLKLNSGSIVELNRTISDPVEVIVNNCVIARGEVVVVDGNYGIRIQQVISREERLRSLN